MDPLHHTIVLVDDHVLVREALKDLIEQLGPYRVTAQFGNGQDFLDALPHLGAWPDLLVLDLSMPVLGGRQTVEALHQRAIDLPVLVLTVDTTPATVLDFVRLGVRGYLPKDSTAATLRAAIEAILDVGYYHSELEQQARREARRSGFQQAAALTPREQEFLTLVCHRAEYSYKQIADRMGIVPRTVDGYREALFSKCHVKTKLGLVFYALRHGLLRLEDL